MATLPEIERFFTGYNQLQASNAALRLREFRQGFESLRTVFDSLSAMSRELDRSTGRAFNIFRLLGVEWLEPRTHSKVLVGLLDPNGTHAQGSVFLRRFLRIAARSSNHRRWAWPFPRCRSIALTSPGFVKAEHDIGTGRIDILLKRYEQSVVIAVENKIFAGEQEEQLSRYGKWLKDHETRPWTTALIFLTPDGRKSETAGDYPYSRMSYKNHIASWLEGCITEVEAIRVREILRQYLETVRKISLG